MTYWRKRRIETARLIKQAENELRENPVLRENVLELFKEAVKCYGHGLIVATYVTCRATLEAALYIWRYWTHARAVKGKIVSVSISLPMKMTSLEKLIKEASSGPNRILNDHLLNLAKSVKNIGDVGAHLVERSDKSRWEASRQFAQYRIWVASEEAEKALENLATVLILMSQKIKEKIVYEKKSRSRKIRSRDWFMVKAV